MDDMRDASNELHQLFFGYINSKLPADSDILSTDLSDAIADELDRNWVKAVVTSPDEEDEKWLIDRVEHDQNLCRARANYEHGYRYFVFSDLRPIILRDVIEPDPENPTAEFFVEKADKTRFDIDDDDSSFTHFVPYYAIKRKGQWHIIPNNTSDCVPAESYVDRLFEKEVI